MSDFKFLKNPISNQWVILAPRRARRPDISKGTEPVCPFCIGREGDEEELYRVQKIEDGGQKTETRIYSTEVITENKNLLSDFRDPSSVLSNPSSDWLIRVLKNKYPFAPHHEVIIHSPDHHKNFTELEKSHVEILLQTYRFRFNVHKDDGYVYLFHNRGLAGGESLPHAHTQLAVIPFEVKPDIPRLGTPNSRDTSDTFFETTHFTLFCPQTSQWPDEVWIAPKKRGRAFGEITDDEVSDLAHVLPQLIKILSLRHNNDFPFNFYIYPGGDWYLRITPRLKRLGGFEIGTGIFINTQEPKETIQFIQTHFVSPDEDKIRKEHFANYHKAV